MCLVRQQPCFLPPSPPEILVVLGNVDRLLAQQTSSMGRTRASPTKPRRTQCQSKRRSFSTGKFFPSLSHNFKLLKHLANGGKMKVLNKPSEATPSIGSMAQSLRPESSPISDNPLEGVGSRTRWIWVCALAPPLALRMLVQAGHTCTLLHPHP